MKFALIPLLLACAASLTHAADATVDPSGYQVDVKSSTLKTIQQTASAQASKTILTVKTTCLPTTVTPSRLTYTTSTSVATGTLTRTLTEADYVGYGSTLNVTVPGTSSTTTVTVPATSTSSVATYTYTLNTTRFTPASETEYHQGPCNFTAISSGPAYRAARSTVTSRYESTTFSYVYTTTYSQYQTATVSSYKHTKTITTTSTVSYAATKTKTFSQKLPEPSQVWQACMGTSNYASKAPGSGAPIIQTEATLDDTVIKNTPALSQEDCCNQCFNLVGCYVAAYLPNGNYPFTGLNPGCAIYYSSVAANTTSNKPGVGTCDPSQFGGYAQAQVGGLTGDPHVLINGPCGQWDFGTQ